MNNKIKIENLPVEFKVEPPNRIVQIVLNFTLYGGIGILIIGIGFILLGPDEIFYSVSEGMTFMQFLQAYPGPIASIGIALIITSLKLISHISQKHGELVYKTVEARLEIENSDIPEDHTLKVRQLAEGLYFIGIEKKENEQIENLID